jgi:hypothetical protein
MPSKREVSLTLVFVLGDTWPQLLNAVYPAFVFLQISLLAHDFGHRGVGGCGAIGSPDSENRGGVLRGGVSGHGTLER